MTDWNRHTKVGGTLLENWVEEREQERELIDQNVVDRPNPKTLTKHGHAGILEIPRSRATKGGMVIPITSTNHDSYSKPVFASQTRFVGRKRQLAEAEMLKRALEDIQQAKKEEEESSSSNEWKSVNQNDFDHSDMYKIQDLASIKLSAEDGAKYGNGPSITHWTNLIKNVDGSTRQTFGKNPDFSTPIEEYRGGACK